MLAKYLRSEKTPLAFEEAVRVMRTVLARKLGWTPARPVLSLALARSALETSRFRTLYDYNFGNFKVGESHAGTYTCRPCSVALETGQTWLIPEGELDRKDGCVVGKVWLVPPGHPQTRFRVYRDAIEGAERYLEAISVDHQRRAWEALLLGDAVGYVHALKVNGYFVDDEYEYGCAIVDLQDEFWRRLEGLPASEVAVPTRDEIEALLEPDLGDRAPVEATDVPATLRSGSPESRPRDSQVELAANDVEVPSSEPPGRVA